MKRTVLFSRVTLTEGRCFTGVVELQYLPRDENDDQGWHAHITVPDQQGAVVVSSRIIDLIEPLEDVTFQLHNKEWRRLKDWELSDDQPETGNRAEA